MCDLTKQFSNKTFCLVSFILLCSFFTSKNVFSENHWNRDFVKVTYNSVENSISIKFKVIDYYKGSHYEKGYLAMCYFYYTIDEKSYKLLMRSDADDQLLRNFTELKMKYKQEGTELRFLGCNKPKDNSRWPDNNEDVIVSVKNEVDG